MAALIVLGVIALVVGGAILLTVSFLVRISGWSSAYQKVGKRYAATVSFSAGKPKMQFNYAGQLCQIKNIGARQKENRRTQLILPWVDRRLKIHVSSLGPPSGMFSNWKLSELDIPEKDEFDFFVFTNDAKAAEKIINPTTRWQIQRLANHHGYSGVEIALNHGKIRISKPGFIKEEIQLDDFVRFSLEMYDQFRLAVSGDIEFVSSDDAVIIDDVICPICSEKIQQDLVTCLRCRTPHCQDCWEYNGQCATFACNEKRFVSHRGAAKSGTTV